MSAQMIFVFYLILFDKPWWVRVLLYIFPFCIYLYVGMSVFISDESLELDFENLVFLHFLHFHHPYESCTCTILDFTFSTVNGHLLSVSDDLFCKIKVFNFYYLLGCRNVTVLMFTCFVGLCIFFRRMPVNFIVQEICSLEQWHSKIKKKI